MNKRYFMFLFLFLLFVAVIYGIMFAYNEYRESLMVRGQYTFANTRKHIADLSAISMQTPEYGTINIYKKSNEWRFKEANDYFINPDMLSGFYNMVNNSIITTTNHATEKQLQNNELLPENGTIVRTYGRDMQILDEIIIGKYLENSKLTYARKAKNKVIYTINNVGVFSGAADAWIPYPLFSIDDDIIADILIDGVKIEESSGLNKTEKSMAILKLMQILKAVDFVGLTYQSELKEHYAHIKPHRIDVLVAGGLIYVLHIYEIEDTYWMTVKLRMDNVARRAVADFVKENQKYFADWLFRLNAEQGRQLYDIADRVNK